MCEEEIQEIINMLNKNDEIFYRVYFKKNAQGFKEYYMIGQISAHHRLKIEKDEELEAVKAGIDHIHKQFIDIMEGL